MSYFWGRTVKSKIRLIKTIDNLNRSDSADSNGDDDG
jgi:hypothetical protein